MSKNTKYPRKFRQKLEKIAEARDERQALQKQDEHRNPFGILWHDFFMHGSVHLMHTRFDEVKNRLVSIYHLHPPYKSWRVFADPPWNTDKGVAP